MKGWWLASSVIDSYTASALTAGPMIDITPSVTTLTTRSDRETSVIYTVVNTMHSTRLTNLRINPGYQITGLASDLSLQNDTCSGQNLAPQAACQFGVILSGNNQPSSVRITPSVCNGTQQVCSTAPSEYALTVQVDSINQIPYAYIGLLTDSSHFATHKLGASPISDAVLPINTENNAFGTAVTDLYLNGHSNAEQIGSTIVSPNGSQVYAAVIQSDSIGHPVQTLVSPDNTLLYINNQDHILRYSITANSSYSYKDQINTFYAGSMAISNDGNTLYFSGAADNILYQINTQTFTTPISVATTENQSNAGIALTPNNNNLFVSSYLALHFKQFSRFTSFHPPTSNLLDLYPSVVSNLTSMPTANALALTNAIPDARFTTALIQLQANFVG